MARTPAREMGKKFMFGNKESKAGSHFSPKEFAVIGLGRFGTSVALGLVKSGHSVLGIDSDPGIVQRLSGSITQTVALDSTDIEALREVDMGSYDTVVVAIGTNFEPAALTVVALKELGVRFVVAKATNIVHESILHKIGVDRVVLPEFEAGAQLADELVTPTIREQIYLKGQGRVSLIRVPSKIEGRTLQDLAIHEKYGVTVVAVQRGQETIVAPPGDLVLSGEDELVVIGTADRIALLGC